MNHKLIASVGGVLATGAVVVGFALGTAGNSYQPRQPAAPREVGATIPAVATVTVTASPTPTVAAKVTPSAKKRKHPARKRRAVIVIQQQRQQGAPVTDPEQPPSDPTTNEPPAVIIDQGPGTVDEGGVLRAPRPTFSHPQPPPVVPLPLGPGAPPRHS